MNRTIEQWSEVAEHAGNSLLIQSISDLQRLAQQLEHVKSALADERSAWSAKRAELLRKHAAEQIRRLEAEAQRDELLGALQIAHDHIDMAALEISHCKDAEVIRSAVFSAKEQTK